MSELIKTEKGGPNCVLSDEFLKDVKNRIDIKLGDGEEVKGDAFKVTVIIACDSEGNLELYKQTVDFGSVRARVLDGTEQSGGEDV